MYSDKKNILQLVALLIEHGVSNIVLCPGSRNSPIVHTLANHSFFNCHSVTDERSAGFFAVGLALHGGKPAAVCCTSGTEYTSGGSGGFLSESSACRDIRRPPRRMDRANGRTDLAATRGVRLAGEEIGTATGNTYGSR